MIRLHNFPNGFQKPHDAKTPPSPLDIGMIHFVGIGGIGMSGIAEILHALGYHVQGSDLNDNANVKRLRDKGIAIAIGHKAENLGDAAVVVISSAVKRDNSELIAARQAHLPVVRRAEMLGELMRLKWSVAVGGTHGKTTTTSMVAALFDAAGLDPTVINGGIINDYGTNARLGTGDWMVVETDESDGSFTKLPSTICIVTNMDPEHMDHYKDFDAVKQAYATFVDNIPFYSFGVLCIDHPEVQALIGRIQDRRIISYGFSPQADVRALNVQASPEGMTFDVSFTDRKTDETKTIAGFHTQVIGQHNVQNALAALTVGWQLGFTEQTLRAALAKFSGVKRRFTKTGTVNNITIIDDYGHHPVEIAATLKAAAMVARGSAPAISQQSLSLENVKIAGAEPRATQHPDATKGRVIAVMQPHRYTRLSNLFTEFCSAFNDADIVIVADVYPAGEQPIKGATRDALVEGLRAHGHREVHALPSPQDLAPMIAKLAHPGDYIICLGAGTVSQWAYALPGELENQINGSAGSHPRASISK